MLLSQLTSPLYQIDAFILLFLVYIQTDEDKYILIFNHDFLGDSSYLFIDLNLYKMSISEKALSLLLPLDYLIFQADVICFLLFEKHHSRVTGGQNQNGDISWRCVNGINFGKQKKESLEWDLSSAPRLQETQGL